jgi:hypothetical protein
MSVIFSNSACDIGQGAACRLQGNDHSESKVKEQAQEGTVHTQEPLRTQKRQEHSLETPRTPKRGMIQDLKPLRSSQGKASMPR